MIQNIYGHIDNLTWLLMDYCIYSQVGEKVKMWRYSILYFMTQQTCWVHDIYIKNFAI